MKKNNFFLKYFLLISIILSFANATDLDGNPYEFIVETPEIVDSYFNLLNGVSAIFQSQTYEDLLRLIFLLGSFFVFASGIFKSWENGGTGALGKLFAYLLGGFMVIFFIFSGKSDIEVKSNQIYTFCNGSQSKTMDTLISIPAIMAYGIEFTNAFGVELTRLAETAYSSVSPNAAPVNETKMTNNGGYGSALKQTLSLMNVKFNKVSLNDKNGTTPVDSEKIMRTLFAQCILVPFSGKGVSGQEEIDRFKSSNNLFKALSDLYDGYNSDESNDNSKVVGGIHAGQYEANLNGVTEKCGDIWLRVKDLINDNADKLSCAYPVGKGAIQIITGNASPGVSDFKQVAIQSGLISAFNETQSQLGVGVDGISYGVGKTRSEFLQTALASGQYMAKMLPYLQMTIRAILYAFLPFVLVIVLLPGGLKVLLQYLQSLIWIELWTPVAAILNMFMAQAQEYKIQEFGQMTPLNAVDMLSSSTTIAGVAGYLYASVPALTWLVLKGSAYMLGSIGNAMSAGIGKNINTDTINKDVADIKEAQQMSLATGEQFSLAEASHFKALSMGAKSGATLGVERDVGLNTVAKTIEFSKRGEIASFRQLQNLNKGLSIAALADKIQEPKSFDTTVKANAYDRVAGVDGSETSFGHQLENVSINEIKGSQDGKVQANLSKSEYSTIEKGKLGSGLSQGELVNNFGGVRSFARFDSGLKSWNMTFQSAQQETFGDPTLWGHASASASVFNTSVTNETASILGSNAVTKAATASAFGIDSTVAGIDKMGGYSAGVDATSTATALSSLTSSKTANGLGGISSASQSLADMQILNAKTTQGNIEKIGGGSIDVTADIMSDVTAGNTLGTENAIGMSGGLSEYVRKIGQQTASQLDITDKVISNMGIEGYIDGASTSQIINYDKALSQQKALETVAHNSKVRYDNWQDVIKSTSDVTYTDKNNHVVSATLGNLDTDKPSVVKKTIDGGIGYGQTLVGSKVAHTLGMNYSQMQLTKEFVSSLSTVNRVSQLARKGKVSTALGLGGVKAIQNIYPSVFNVSSNKINKSASQVISSDF